MGAKEANRWSGILNGRSAGGAPEWVPQDQQDRHKAYGVLRAYFYSVSNQALDLPPSLNDNWKDPGTVRYVAETYADLIMHNSAMVVAGGSDAQNEALLTWYEKASLRKAIHANEARRSVYGDALIKVTYSETTKSVVWIVEDPRHYYPISDDECMLIRPSDKSDTLYYVEHYRVTEQGCMMQVGYVKRQTDRRNQKLIEERPVMGADREEAPWQSIGINRLPLVHIPAGDPDPDGWGCSDFATCLCELDTFHQIRTDKALGCRLLGVPPIFAWGEKDFRVEKDSNGHMKIQAKVAPGTMYWLGSNGGMSTVDQSAALEMLDKEEKATWNMVLIRTKLTPAGVGEVAGISGMRDREIKIFFGPTVRSIASKRHECIYGYRKCLALSHEMWQSHDSAGYAQALAGASLDDVDILFGELLPEDAQTRISMLSQAVAARLLSEETGTRETIEVMGIGGDTDAERKRIEADKAREAENLAASVMGGGAPTQ